MISHNKYHSGTESIAGEIKVLRVHSDPKDNFFALYFQDGSNDIQRVVLAEFLAEAERTVEGILDTERYLRNDPVAKPDPDIVHATEVSEYFFEHVVHRKDEKSKMQQKEFLLNLGQQRDSLNQLTRRFKRIALAHREGAVRENDPELASIISSIHPW